MSDTKVAEDLERSLARIAALEIDKAHLNNHITRLLGDFPGIHARYGAELEQVKAENAELREQLAATERELLRARAGRDEWGRSCLAAQEELERVKADNRDLRDLLSKEEHDGWEARSECFALQRKLKEAEQEIKTARFAGEVCGNIRAKTPSGSASSAIWSAGRS